MSIRRYAFAVVLAAAAALSITGATRAQTPKNQAPCPDAIDAPDALAGRPLCFLEAQRVVSVRPYYNWTTLRGAKIDLAPEIGVTAEDLEARVQQALDPSARTRLPACLIGVSRVHIRSAPAGEASSLTLIAKEPRDAERILSRAQLLMR